VNAAGPAHKVILDAVLERWPEHESALERGLPENAEVAETTELVSQLLSAFVGNDLDRFVHGYRWMCEMVLEEEFEFRRTGAYRYSRFADALEKVYSAPEVMGPYMDGLLLSQVLWSNHQTVLDFYRRCFVPQVARGRHLEVGPGHGLLLWMALQGRPAAATAWDVSRTSLERALHTIEQLGRPAEVAIALVEQDLYGSDATGRFDSVVISEVLEHVERPLEALQRLRERMPVGGCIFVNAPVNSPALDHIFLFRTPEELATIVEQAGFQVTHSVFAPASGLTERRARKMGFAISTAIIGRAT
jgi:2-polyprenyl-3-methyl-5-hydroxy-6-metoxy-1,4-benzoquinol methylase